MTDHAEGDAWIAEEAWTPAMVTGTSLVVLDDGSTTPWPDGLVAPSSGDYVLLDGKEYLVSYRRWDLSGPSLRIFLIPPIGLAG